MGQQTTLVIPIIVFTSVMLIPSMWLTWKTVQLVIRKALPQYQAPSMEKVTSIGSATDSSMDTTIGIQRQTSTMVVSNHKSVQPTKKNSSWSLRFTAISSVSYTCSLVMRLIEESLLCNRVCDDLNNAKRIWNILWESKMARYTWTVYIMIVYFANLTLASTCFLRLRSTFKATRYKLSDRSIKVCKCVVIFSSVMLTLSLLVFVMGESDIAGLIAIPGWFPYPFFFLWIVYRFMSTTRIIAQKMVFNRRSLSMGHSIDESALKRSEELLDASLRLTIVTLLATFSTMLPLFILAIIFFAGSRSRFPVVLFAFDGFCNVYCLHCTFAEHTWYYLTFLGWLHRWLLAKLLKMR